MAGSVIVTGAESGIGLASVKLIINEGYNVTAFDPQIDLMENSLPKKENLFSFKGDI